MAVRGSDLGAANATAVLGISAYSNFRFTVGLDMRS